jgi:hypothetical protein
VRVRRVLAVLLCAATASGVLAAPSSAQEAPAVLDWRANACRPAEPWRPAGVPPGAFADTAGSPFASAVDCLLHVGVTQGAAGGGYRSGDPVTRAQMAAFLVRTATLLGVPDIDTRPTTFTDVDALPAEQRAAVAALAAAGVAQGRTATTFAPQEPVTRGQMAAFLHRLHRWVTLDRLEHLFGSTRRFDDVDEPFRTSADALANAGIAAGTGERRFSPEQRVTRGQMAGFLARLLELAVRQHVWAPPFPAGNDAWPVTPHGAVGPVVADEAGSSAPSPDQVTVTWSGLSDGSSYNVDLYDHREVRRGPSGFATYPPGWRYPGQLPAHVDMIDGVHPTGGRLRAVVDGAGEGRVVAVLWQDRNGNQRLDQDNEYASASAVIHFVQPLAEPGSYGDTGNAPQAGLVVEDRDQAARRVRIGGRWFGLDPRTDVFLLRGRRVDLATWLGGASDSWAAVDHRTGPHGASTFAREPFSGDVAEPPPALSPVSPAGPPWSLPPAAAG